MKIDAVILGASGYGGGELLYWLSRHPNVGSVRGTSRSLAGSPFSLAHPNLRGVVEGRFEPHSLWSSSGKIWQELAQSEQPVVLAALPHGELARTLPTLEAAWAEAGIADRLLLLDLSGDFRIRDPAAFEKANRTPHPCPELLSRFVYGLPEWNRDAISRAKRIASPGCFATALQLALLPWRGLNVGFIAANAVTGSSGSGATPSPTTHHATRANDFRAYKMLAHQHLAEVRMMMSACDIPGTLAFVPHSGPFVRGIFATIQFAKPNDLDLRQLEALVADVFSGCPFVRIVEESPRVAAVAGSNFADVAIAADENSVAVMVAIDNLGKGMAGQAVQSMNIALGLPETTGLWSVGRFLN
ncbi:MAG: N-acetyl-gamma-glutamyl-phosphate reductase [Verrucomicrobia bacterium]|nr:MAG: N-acetyl-gamma-glutamyl-phosphate reductase [Verrucomicrobiota bacterium]